MRVDSKLFPVSSGLRIVGLSVLVLGTGLLSAQPTAPAAAATAAVAAVAAKAPSSAPKVTVVKDNINVGTVAKGEVIEQDFILRNDGAADLHITDVKPACGCTVSKFDKVIAPGKEGKVHLTVDTKAFSGMISKSAVVLTDDPASPQLTVFIQANVKPFVEVLPYGFFRIQGLVGEEISNELTLVSDEAGFKPTNPQVLAQGPDGLLPATYMSAKVAPLAEKDRAVGKGANQWKVTLTAAKSAPVGIPAGVVKVATGLAKQPEVEMRISGSIAEAVGVVPAQVSFGAVQVKEEAIKKELDVVNRNMKNEGFAVTSVESNVPGITAEVKPFDKNRVKVVVSVDPKGVKKGVVDGQLTIRTNDASRAEIKIPMKGTIL